MSHYKRKLDLLPCFLFVSFQMWADPGKYALIGAAAQLGEKLSVLFSSSSVAFTNEMS